MRGILKCLRSSGPDADMHWERPRQIPSRHLNLSLFLSCTLDAPGVAGGQEAGVTLSEKLSVCVYTWACVPMCIGALPVVSCGGDGAVVN